MSNALRWGIIGLGKISTTFVRDLLLLPDHTIQAVGSRSIEKADAFKQKFGANKAYGSYEDLFRDEEVDIVYIGTPHDSHAEISIKAMKAGKHVLCEKPLAVNKKQVQEMVDTSVNANVFLMEAFWARFNPSIESVLARIESGELGDVNYVNVDFTFNRNDAEDSRMLSMDLAGGSLLDMGVYPVFLAYAVFGMPDQILAAGRFHKTGADIQTSAIFKYKNGIANVMSGFVSQSDMTAKIHGTNGMITIDAPWHEAQGYKMNTKGIVKNYPLPTHGKGFTGEIKECKKCIDAGMIQSKKWSHQNSLDLISLTDEIRNQIGLKYPFE